MPRQLGLLALLLMAGLPALAQESNELVDRTSLRVCADPSDLPFSNDKGEGFENRIADLMAKRLGLPLAYTWYPQTMGFVRNTLRARRCDLIMGVVAADELVQNSNPYYRSTYVMAVRDADKERLSGLDAPAMMAARIGVVAGTPPAELLARRGLLAGVRSYQLLVDTRHDNPTRQLLADLASGEIDAGLLWGPIAGYWTKADHLPLSFIPIPSDPKANLRMDFRISMGIRPGEPEWKREVNGLIRALQPEITRVLDEYGIPRLDEQGQLVTAAEPVPAAVPEPAGYRMDQFRAPVPATLQGARVLDTPALKAMLAAGQAVLVDVLPKPRKPENRDPAQVWIEPRREDIPGSTWVPNVGYGELTPEFKDFFTRELDRLAGGDKAKPLVFYCDSDCWMSWNAAKRAIVELGYTNVCWYPPGAKGWHEAGGELALAQSRPMPGWSQ